ncbi:MAG: phosphoenolpyruvate kinase, partial [Candidatus Eremiobacteraeota bacterium]|nr:phosphoenolpyruvate kinase [Candidatus Eremiobacteraeota bacterium]
MHSTLSQDDLSPVLSHLERANRAYTAIYPGESSDRQPVHTVYGGAQLFVADRTVRLGEAARRVFEEVITEPEQLMAELEPGRHSPELARRLYQRVREKLEREPVEDFRIDFEDGYGNRPDEEEDGHAVKAAQEVALGHRQGSLSPFIGIRLKPFNEELKRRSIRTMDLFLTTLVKECAGDL